MKYSKKIILISILTLMMLPLFLIPRTAVAQEWTYDGADTEIIPDFSVYPSEMYNYNETGIYASPENYTIIEILKANITALHWELTTWANGTLIWVKLTMVNATSGEKWIQAKEIEMFWWNQSFGYHAWFPFIIPIEKDGTVSEDMLNNVTSLIDLWCSWAGITFENSATYYKEYFFHYWNSSYNNAYLRANFTDDGILTKFEHYKTGFDYQNYTLMSQPAQKAPAFDFTTEHDTLTVNSTEFKLKINITDADNNNDGEIDTDYLYRIQNGTEWSDWADVPNLADWDLGDVEAGSYVLTIEVKNMYGVTQKEITIEYEPPKKKREIIPSYPFALISIIVIFSISIIIHRYRKKLRL